MYAAAKSLLASSKLPIKMAGVSLATSLYVAEGAAAKEDLGVGDVEMRIQSQVGGCCNDAAFFLGGGDCLPSPLLTTVDASHLC